MASLRTDPSENEEIIDPVLNLCTDIVKKLPPEFDVEAVFELYPIVYTNSMNTVLRLELIRYCIHFLTIVLIEIYIKIFIKGLTNYSAIFDHR